MVAKFRLNALGDAEFESMVQSLLKRVIGPGTTTFGPGKDGAREATYSGEAPYPSTADRWTGEWIFQAKFHDIELVGTGAARNSVIADAKAELKKLTEKYDYKVHNYILITNVPLSAVHKTGTLDRLESEVFSKYRNRIAHLAVWGADDINRLLDLYPEVTRGYLPLLITGDIIAELLTQVEQSRSDRATTIEMYLRTTISREENAQLDQAGDVSEDAIPLQQIFFDLDAYIPLPTREALDRQRSHPLVTRSLPLSPSARVPMVRYLASNNAPDRTVIVGGPGEGKSTIGQYLAQIHRATLVGKSEDIAISADYVPETPRLPFRVALKDFAQWLADSSVESSESASLDAYITDQVTRLSTRAFSEKDLHDVLKTDPCLVILDGLDEVTESLVRRRLMQRLLEFLDRCQNVLHCDLQVIATTRPANYSDQFDPKTFLHFHLHKLEASQVRDYVAKWTIARVLDEDKATRLRKTIEECLADNQISPLMTTPLQVTILILIINSGGTPPRQREALFDEYLEVIYKREKAKGLGIVRTEKELLIGLHKFVGYILHEEATSAQASSAILPRSAYEIIVKGYLRNYDPYSPPDKIEHEWHSITVDAGERLVLIVESPANCFGFELRSIQEFFAACYLSDTAKDTLERYSRFERIVQLPHWRNVALFFAGRIGRSYPGEAANVVEVCKDIDRHGPDLFVRRGAEVALELAAERALGPNRVLQRSLLEHGLGIFDIPVSFAARRAAIELVERLPYEDIRDHVLPILEQRLPTLASNAVVNACYLLGEVAPRSDILARSLIRVVSEASDYFAEDLLLVVVGSTVSADLRMTVVRALLDAGVEAVEIGEGLAYAEWPTLCAIATELDAADVDRRLIDSFASHAAVHATYAARAADDSAALPPDGRSLSVLFRCARALGSVSTNRPNLSQRTSTARHVALREKVSAELPEAVRRGVSDGFGTPREAIWLPWLTHLALGDVTLETWQSFVLWLADYEFTAGTRGAWTYFARQLLSPIASLITGVAIESDLAQLGPTVISLAGSGGYADWLDRLGRLQNELASLSYPIVRKVAAYGLGALSPPLRARVSTILDGLFEVHLQPIALEWMNLPRRGGSLTAEDVDSAAEWFGTLPPKSPWRQRSPLARIASQAVSLDLVQSPEFATFLPSLSDYIVADLACQIAARGSARDLRFLLSQRPLSMHGRLPENFAAMAPPPKRRQIILNLLSLADDVNEQIRASVCAVVIGVCVTASEDDSPRSAIRSTALDVVHKRLITSTDSVERATGIALYAVRPPRSAHDWQNVQRLLQSATDNEIDHYWSWVLIASADLATDARTWAESITSILRQGVDEKLGLLLTDVLRKVLPRESQSLASSMQELSLPRVDIRSPA